MNYNLNIQSEDFPFVIEAIKLRTLALINSLETQVKGFHEAKEALEKAGSTPAQAVQEAIQGYVFQTNLRLSAKPHTATKRTANLESALVVHALTNFPFDGS